MRDSTMTSDPNPDARGLKLIFAFASIYLIWGSMYLAIRWGLDGIPPLILMSLRHLAAALILLAWLVWRGVKINRRLWKAAFVTGAIMFLGGHGLLSWAELRVGSGLASMIGATEPIIMVLLAGFLGQERHASGRIVLGMVLGLVGIGVLVGVGHGHDSTLGTVAVLASAILWSVGAVYGRGVDNGGSVILRLPKFSSFMVCDRADSVGTSNSATRFWQVSEWRATICVATATLTNLQRLRPMPISIDGPTIWRR
jgi:drug/metabolite transporter (DMT)-like permease